jgi:hypothetical protein
VNPESKKFTVGWVGDFTHGPGGQNGRLKLRKYQALGPDDAAQSPAGPEFALSGLAGK